MGNWGFDLDITQLLGPECELFLKKEYIILI